MFVHGEYKYILQKAKKFMSHSLNESNAEIAIDTGPCRLKQPSLLSYSPVCWTSEMSFDEDLDGVYKQQHTHSHFTYLHTYINTHTLSLP